MSKANLLDRREVVKKLLANRKERLFTSGIGLSLLAERFSV